MSNAADLELQSDLVSAGFAFAGHPVMRELLARHGGLPDWQEFADSWHDLVVDEYLATTGHHRRRRHAVFSWERTRGFRRQPARAHHQSVANNQLQGGLQRWFAPIAEGVGGSRCMKSILGFAGSLFGTIAPATLAWDVEVHQFRIEARGGQTGDPTPEGVHRDGVDYVLVLLVNRENITSGTTSIHAHGRELGQFTLTAPLDSALVDDARVMHGVTSVAAIAPSEPAYRDVLVVTFRAVSLPSGTVPSGNERND